MCIRDSVQSYGINLICIEEGIGSSQTSGKLFISVLSAVAEIERENIIEQTMNGRREKEAEAIRIISDKFGNSGIGLGGVAKYLNLQGIKKILRQNGKLETWSSHLIRQKTLVKGLNGKMGSYDAYLIPEGVKELLYERREGDPGVSVSVETGISAGETRIPKKAKYPVSS